MTGGDFLVLYNGSVQAILRVKYKSSSIDNICGGIAMVTTENIFESIFQNV